MAKNYVIYGRNAVKPADGTSAAQQIARCKALVSSIGGNVVAVFKDIGVSGAEGEKAPARDQLIKRVRVGDIDCVVVEDLARLSRCVTTIVDITSEMEDSGVHLLIAHNPGFDNDPE